MEPGNDGEGPSNEASSHDDEAQWALTTARTLQTRGDTENAVQWYRRAVEHLMQAGNDEAALEVARHAAALSSAPPPPATRVPTSPSPAVRVAPPARVATPSTQTPPPVSDVHDTRDTPDPIDASMSGEVSAEASAELLAALRRAVSFQPGRAAAAEVLASRIANLPLFRDLPGETVHAVARQVSVVHFDPGELMLTAGRSGPETPAYVLLEGRGLLRATGEEGPGIPLGPGDFVGEIAALYGGRAVMSASVRAAVTALSLPRSLICWLAREFPSVRVALEDAAWERAFSSVGRAAPFLRRLTPDQRGVAYARFEPVLLNAGDLLLGEGAPPLALWLIAAGEVEVYGGGLNGREPLRAHAGDLVGLKAILGGEPSGVSARTLGTVLAAKVGVHGVRSLLERHPALAGALEDVGIPGRAVVC